MSDDFFFLEDDENEPRKHKPQRGGLSWGSVLVLVGLLAVVIVLGLQLAQQNAGRPMPGMTPPDFTLDIFKTDDALTLSELRGQIVIINFWGSWCAPCRQEAPDLQAIWEDYGDQGVMLIGVNWLDTDINAEYFMREFGITYPNGPDIGEDIASDYNIQGAPETFIIDQNGVVAQTIIGHTTYDRLAGIVDGLLEANT